MMRESIVHSLTIIALCIFAAIAYGIVHDQITARVCVEYFTIAHPPVFDTDSPTLLGLGWGVIATWWVALMLGLPLAVCATAGSAPRISAGELVRPILLLLAVMGATALVAGILGYFLTARGVVRPPRPFTWEIPPAKHARFVADAWAHLASYGMGLIGGIDLMIWTVGRRRRCAANP